MLAYRLGFLEPGLSAALKGYWAAAMTGDNQGAAQFKAVFDAGHPKQTMLLNLTAALVVASAAAGWWSLVSDPNDTPADGVHR